MTPTKNQVKHDETIKNKLLSFRGATPITATPKKELQKKKSFKATKPLKDTLKELQDFIKTFQEKRKSVNCL
jgi:gas vesicle protein